MIHIITICFSNADQIERALDRFKKVAWNSLSPDFRQHLVSGHYPLDYSRNENRIMWLAFNGYDSDHKINYLVPGCDLGSAQSQNWAIEQIKPEIDDYIVNLDPDSACDVPGWLGAMKKVMDADPKLAMVHLTNPYVWERIRFGYHPFTFREVAGEPLAVPMAPEQFNMTMYRYSWLKEIGGILQGSLVYGNVEGLMWMKARETGMYSGYLTNYIESYDLKPMENKELRDWKMAHCHSERFNVPYFPGTFGEYCKIHGYT